MAVTVRNSQTSAGVSVTIPACVSGNLIVLFVAQATTLVTPTLAGFTGIATSTQYNTSANSGFYLYKISTGGETVLAPTAGSGGTISGVTAIEIVGLGASFTIDGAGNVPVAANNLTSTGNTTTAITTSNSGSIILTNTGANASMASMTWDAALTAYTTTGAITLGAYQIPGTTVSAKTYVNTLGTGRVHGNLTLALAPTAVATTGSASMMMM